MAYPPLATFFPQLYGAATDATSAVYLPLVVLDQTLPLEPYTVSAPYTADVNTFGAGLADTLWTATGNSGSGASGQITFSAIQLIGTSNVLPQSPSVSGNTVTMTFAFGGVTATPLLPIPPALQVAANVAVTLTLGGSSAQISGSVSAAFNGASLVLTTAIDPSTYVTSVQSAVFAASGLGAVSGSPGMFQISVPGGRAAAVATALNTAFAQPAAAAAVVQYANTQLAGNVVLSMLSRALTGGLQSLANPQLLSFVASMLYKAGVNPNGQYYLPNQLRSASNPPIEPYSAGGWNLGDMGSYLSSAGGQICTGVYSVQGLNGIQSPGTAVPVDLSGIMIAGLSNALPSPLLTVNNTVYGMASFNVVTKWPFTFDLSGKFKLGVTCCPTTDFSTCSGPPDPSTGLGTFGATIAQASVSAQIAISSDGTNLNATVVALRFRADPNIVNSQNMVFTIDITSVPEDQRAIWDKQAENLFNAPAAAASIVAQIQSQMNEPNVLASISTMITNAIHGVLGAHEDRHLASRVIAQVAERCRKEQS